MTSIEFTVDSSLVYCGQAATIYCGQASKFARNVWTVIVRPKADQFGYANIFRTSLDIFGVIKLGSSISGVVKGSSTGSAAVTLPVIIRDESIGGDTRQSRCKCFNAS